jgi:magnesium transporter
MFRSSTNTEDSGAIYTPDIIEAAASRRASTGLDSTQRTAFEERLREIIVFELREDGSSEYSTMSLRALYNYVVTCIAQSCKEGKVERQLLEAKQRTRSKSVQFVQENETIPPTPSAGEVNETPRPDLQNPLHLPSLTSSSPPDQTPHTSNNSHVEPAIRHQRQISTIPPAQRLGGYLHPRDMRRLVTPFSSSNEPTLMVRRHVMLLNFDPLRAIVLRDRVLVLVPDGADSILITLEKRVRGGLEEMENDVFGSTSIDESKIKRNKSSETLAKKRLHSHVEAEGTEHTLPEEDEWDEIPNIDWSNVPYELLSVDAVLQTVTTMLADEARQVTQRTVAAVRELRGDSYGKQQGISGMPGDHAQERLRWLKDEINGMIGRIQGFVRALNEMLDEDEDMALMNLSRLITHPERFVQPVSQEILQEESDEPELILEAYLQQALSIVNELELLKAQIMTTQEQISMTLDAQRNKLLYINTLLSLASLVVAIGSFIGSIFGMNVHNPYEDDSGTIWFMRITIGTSVGLICLFFVLAWFFYKQTSTSTDWRKKRF